MTSIKQLIQVSPARSSEIFSKLLETSEGAVKTRQRLLAKLANELGLLAQLEEKHLFPALRKHKEMKELVRAALEDNKQTKQLLTNLERIPADSEEFAKKVADLRRLFQQRVREDRKELLPAIAKVLTEDEAQGVVDGYVTSRAAIAESRRSAAKQRRAAAARVRDPFWRLERETEPEAKAVHDAAGETIESAQDSGQKVVELFGRAAEATGEVARLASMEIGALSKSGEAVRSGLLQLSREWVELAQSRLEGNLDDMVTVARSRTLPELITAQGMLVRHNMEMMVENTQRLLRRSIQVADSAKHPLAEDERRSDRSRL